MSQPKVDLPGNVTPFLAESVIAMTFDNDHDVSRWFDLLDEAYREQESAGSPEWTVLRGRIAEAAAAASFDASAVEYFLDVVEGGGQVAAVVDLVALRDALPDVYWTVYWWRYGEDTEPVEDTADPMGWVSGTAASRLAAAWGEGWQDGLTAHLTARWGEGWEQHPAEHRSAWLDDLLPELLGEDGTADGDGAAVVAEAALREIAVASVAESIAETPNAEYLSPEVVDQMVERVLAELRTA